MRRLVADRVALLLLLGALIVRLALFAEVWAHDLDVTTGAWGDMHRHWANGLAIARGDLLLRSASFVYADYVRDIYGAETFVRLFGPHPWPDSPLYYYFIASVALLTGSASPYAVLLVQALVGVGTCALTYLVADRALGRETARIALLLVACLGELVLYGGFLLREPLLAFMLMWSVHEQLRADERGDPLSWGRAGLVWGLAWLCKSIVIFTLPWLGLWVLRHAMRREQTRADRARRAGRAGLALAAGALLAVTPLVVRNLALGGPALQTTVSTTAVLANQNGPHYFGCYWHEERDYTTRLLARTDAGSSWKVLREAIRTHPTWDSWPRQLGRKAVLLWCPVDFWDNVRFDYFRLVLRSQALCPVDWGWLAPGALVGLCLACASRERFAALLPVLGLVFAFAATALLGGATTRFRLALGPSLAILTGLALVELARHLEARRWTRAITLGLGLVMAGFLVRVPADWLPVHLVRSPTTAELETWIRGCYYSPEKEPARAYLTANARAR